MEAYIASLDERIAEMLKEDRPADQDSDIYEFECLPRVGESICLKGFNAKVVQIVHYAGRADSAASTEIWVDADDGRDTSLSALIRRRQRSID